MIGMLPHEKAVILALDRWAWCPLFWLQELTRVDGRTVTSLVRRGFVDRRVSMLSGNGPAFRLTARGLALQERDAA